jgi:hypothetical protein
VTSSQPVQPPQPSDVEPGVEEIAVEEWSSQVSETGLEFDINRARESVRGGLAFILTVIFGLAVGFPLILIFFGHWDATKEWLQAILPALTGLLGSAMGFYFGTRSENNNNQ